MSDFRDLSLIVPRIQIDLKYATKHNFVKVVLYDTKKAYLISEAAEDLIRAQQVFNQLGLSILVWDAYRPLSISKILWDKTPPDLHKFVGDPAIGSVHNRGCAVDITLINLKTGEQLDMPSEFDDFSDKARFDYNQASELQKRNRELLINTMRANGFDVYINEWWHFNWRNYSKYPVLDIPISDIN